MGIEIVTKIKMESKLVSKWISGNRKSKQYPESFTQANSANSRISPQKEFLSAASFPSGKTKTETTSD